MDAGRINSTGINSNMSNRLLAERAKTDKKDLSAFEAKFNEAIEKKDKAALKEVAADFEEIFVNILLKTMRSSVPKSDIMGSSYQKEVFEGMLDEAYAKEIAQTGGLGIADMISDSLGSFVEKEVDE